MILQTDTISLTLQGNRLLNDIALDVRPGEVLGLIGPNGAGKSTLLRIMAGLLRPETGRVLLDGQDLFTMPPEERGRHLAYLPQEAPAAIGMSVQDVAMLGRLPHRRTASAEQNETAVQQALDVVGMSAFADRSSARLSGGERARVLLARALAVQAPILLADEPVAALDPAQALTVMDLFGQCAVQGQAVAVVLHDLALAARFCTRIAVLSQGRLVSIGTPAEVLTDALFAEVYGVAVRRCGEVAVPWSLVSSARRP
ncbi:ABC transporter ATP-binding protein [Gluconobacter sp. LMG 31484]|uniref:ABC transporter ATP-binding protein n=1 Tax=Gluconobacter vitians TaxID=2728102 RepID=A0ABR9Y487_9PROT|nr:ABC transporter ATP-binding protein [Gluconobacter vitians]MBF0858744.1 ABC transporter ATP-binding protein [Gluconobacter vitians]